MADKRLQSVAYRASLEACWKVDVDWDLYPQKLTDIKSLSDRAGVGVGQLLIAAIIAAVKENTNILAIHMHPQTISVYQVSVGGGICHIKTLYYVSGGTTRSP